LEAATPATAAKSPPPQPLAAAGPSGSSGKEQQQPPPAPTTALAAAAVEGVVVYKVGVGRRSLKHGKRQQESARPVFRNSYLPISTRAEVDLFWKLLPEHSSRGGKPNWSSMAAGWLSACAVAAEQGSQKGPDDIITPKTADQLKQYGQEHLSKMAEQNSKALGPSLQR